MATTMRLLRTFSSKFLAAKDWTDKGLIVEVRSNSYLDNIAKVLGLKQAKFGQPVSIASKPGLVVSLQKEFTYVLMLDDAKPEDEVYIQTPQDYLFSTHNNLQSGQVSLSSLNNFLSARPPFRNVGASMWLNTGQSQIDVFTPLAYGHFCIFSGKTNAGKSLIAGNMIGQFLKRGNNHKVVIVSSNPYENIKNYAKYTEKFEENCFIYTPDSTFPSQFFTPYAALYTACKLRDQGNHVLFLVQDIIHHTFIKETLFSSIHGVIST
jgi:F0F1-type ATP synthase alpha subunit